MTNYVEICSFCGKHSSEVKKLVVSGNVAICNECIDLCQSAIVSNTKVVKNKKSKKSTIPDPQEIKKFLDEFVISQDYAKIVLSVAVSNHYKRLHSTGDIELNKTNIFIVGPSGCGKTLLARTIAKHLDVPFAIADATSLTENGYVGDDPETVIARLLTAANGDPELAQTGIIFIDEIDKISRKGESLSITRDVSGEGVQQALLKMVEGTVVKVPYTGNRKHPMAETVDVDTSKILFIVGGAFEGIDKIVEKRLKTNTLGFNSVAAEQDETSGVTGKDLMQYGIIREFVGRFQTIVELRELSKTELFQVLVGPKNNLISQYKYLFSMDGIDLYFQRDGLEEIIERSVRKKTGARGLQAEIERVLLPHMFSLQEYKKRGKRVVTITTDLVKNPAKLA